jgi:hypothetical protein
VRGAPTFSVWTAPPAPERSEENVGKKSFLFYLSTVRGALTFLFLSIQFRLRLNVVKKKYVPRAQRTITQEKSITDVAHSRQQPYKMLFVTSIFLRYMSKTDFL